MTDELFDYFGKGSKKFEPLDDDLDLPEVSPKRRDDAEEEATAEAEPIKASAQPLDDTPASVETETTADAVDDDDAFAGFGAGLFDASTDELPPRKQVAKAKPAAVAKPVVQEKAANPRKLKLPIKTGCESRRQRRSVRIFRRLRRRNMGFHRWRSRHWWQKSQTRKC